MKLFADQLSLHRALAGLKGEIGPQLGLVSTEVPLISNLNVWRNIAMIYQHNRQAPIADAYAFVMQCLKLFGMEDIAEKRNAALCEQERFFVKVLRAAMVNDAVIVIDRPFNMLPCLEDGSFVYQAINKIEHLFTRCDIIDYIYEKKRYGRIDDQ